MKTGDMLTLNNIDKIQLAAGKILDGMEAINFLIAKIQDKSKQVHGTEAQVFLKSDLQGFCGAIFFLNLAIGRDAEDIINLFE